MTSIDYSYHYRKFHPDTVEHRAATVAHYRRILGRHLHTDRSRPILDVGCGSGYALLALKEMGFSSISGLDCDAGQVKTARERGLDVSVTSDSIHFLREHPGAYQTILALDLIEHIPWNSQLEFVQAIAGALTSDGCLICTVPNANSVLAGRWRYIDWTHHASFTEHSLDFLLFNGGFREIEIMPAEFIVRPANWWMPFLSGGRHWWAFRFFRAWRRLEMMAELGREQGKAVPLSLNLLGVARK